MQAGGLRGNIPCESSHDVIYNIYINPGGIGLSCQQQTDKDIRSENNESRQ